MNQVIRKLIVILASLVSSGAALGTNLATESSSCEVAHEGERPAQKNRKERTPGLSCSKAG